MNNSKFLGVCILISAVIVSMGLIYHAQKTSSKIGRYQPMVSQDMAALYKMDTETGRITKP